MQQSGPRTRRNGTLQSCEPCRKSKLKCDHATPVCGRCIAKDIAHKCFYHPSPMTKKGQGSVLLTDTGRQPSTSTPNQSVTPIQSPASYALAGPESNWVPSGYLGASNCFSILRDCCNEIPPAFETHNITIPRNLQPDPVPVGAEVLRVLYQFPVCDVLIARYQANLLVFSVPDTVINAIIGSIRHVLEHFEPANLTTQLARFASMIFQNSSRPISINRSTTVEQYCASFIGPNFRWEAIGNYFAIAGVALVGTPENDPVLLAANIHKETLLSLLIEASDICVKFCECHPSSVNELLLFLLNSDFKLKTHRYGDIHYLAWRQLGVIAATLTTAGFHWESEPDDDCPFFLSQWRKMCFAVNYSADKNMATFTGRPPLIPYRYCKISPPLDISEEVLVSGSEAVGQAVAQLNGHGWNSGNVYRASFLRLRFFLALLREEVLEIILGCKQSDPLWSDPAECEESVNRVLGKAMASWDTTPSHMRFDHPENGITETSVHKWASRYQLIMPYLEHLYSLFLLRRMLVQRTGVGHAALFDTAREVLWTVNYLSGNKELMVDRSRHYAWLMLKFGVPSASVLALQLLAQAQGTTTYTLPGRTEIIRNLTVFTSSLSWTTRPDHGDYALCIEAERRLTTVLDEILDPTPHPVDSQQPEAEGPGSSSSTTFDSLFENFDFVNMPAPGLGLFTEDIPWP